MPEKPSVKLEDFDQVNVSMTGAGIVGVPLYLSTIKELQQSHEFRERLKSVSGVSAGAIAGAFIVGEQVDQGLEGYEEFITSVPKKLKSFLPRGMSKNMEAFLQEHLDAEAVLKSDVKLHVLAALRESDPDFDPTEFTHEFSHKQHILFGKNFVPDILSNRDLDTLPQELYDQLISSSAAIPYFFERKNKVDGGLVNNIGGADTLYGLDELGAPTLQLILTPDELLNPLNQDRLRITAEKVPTWVTQVLVPVPKGSDLPNPWRDFSSEAQKKTQSVGKDVGQILAQELETGIKSFPVIRKGEIEMPESTDKTQST